MVANTSKLSSTLPKNMEIGQMTVEPLTVVPPKDAPTIEPFNAMPIYKEKQNKEQQFSQRQQLTTSDKKK